MFPAPTAFLLAGIFFTVLTAYLFCSVRLPTPLLLFTLLADKQQLPLLVNDQLETSHVNPNVSRRIVAVGDLHGDFPNALTVLRMTGVVDGNGDWTGNVDYLVQTGDIIDRGDDTIKLFAWMDKLRGQANDVGGEVVSLLGNHEWMNIIGDWRYVYDSEIETFGSVSSRQKMITTGLIGQSWLKNYTTAARVPLHPSLGPVNAPYPSPDPPSTSSPFSHAALSFVHGGLAPNYASLVPYPTRLNDVAHSLHMKLLARDPQPPPYPPNRYPGLPATASREEIEMYASNGPVWYRGWALDDEEQVCGGVTNVMNRIGVRRLIMGHTPNFQNIVARCNGRVIIIDTGISHTYGGKLSALSIDYSVSHAGHDASSWTEREVVKAIYLDREDVLVDEQREVVL